MRRCEMINISESRRDRGRPKKSLNYVIRQDLKVLGLAEDVVHDRRIRRDMNKVLEHIGIAS